MNTLNSVSKKSGAEQRLPKPSVSQFVTVFLDLFPIYVLLYLYFDNDLYLSSITTLDSYVRLTSVDPLLGNDFQFWTICICQLWVKVSQNNKSGFRLRMNPVFQQMSECFSGEVLVL